MSVEWLPRLPLAVLTVLLVCLNAALVIQNRELKSKRPPPHCSHR